VVNIVQLLKCFEVANSLADTVLLASSGAISRLELGPQDFLHALYQKILPFLDQDDMLKSILRAKTAEALITAPARLLTMGTGDLDLTLARNRSVSAGSLEYIPCRGMEEQDDVSSSDNFHWLSLLNQQMLYWPTP
jgi:hypothetical protein